MQDLMKQNKNLKDRNDELEYIVMNKNERGRARKRGRRTSRYKSFNIYRFNLFSAVYPKVSREGTGTVSSCRVRGRKKIYRPPL